MLLSLLDSLRPYTPVAPPKDLAGFAAFVESAKPFIPIPSLLVVITAIWLVFRRTWLELDESALRERSKLLAIGKSDLRPLVALVMCALILSMQEYYGGRTFFELHLYPVLAKSFHARATTLAKYDELLGFGWWAGTRIGGYLLPLALWKIFFRRDSILDFGLRTKGFLDHVWIYALFFVVVVPAMFIVSSAPDFATYYPFYKSSTRSWFDFLVWEAMYFAQFFALEMFFRGFWLGALRRSFGSGAIFAMAVPYCMIHFGKPYLEAVGAIVAGIALGSLSMKTKSIYQGFLLHITIAALMDWLSLRRRHCTPLTFWASDTPSACLVDAPLRDALATKIEIGVGVGFGVLVVIVLALFVRGRRRNELRLV
ncbi:MAG TPA: CPBP family intramembrane glutamic endopeptidase [Labilithrix sp.]|nr:CPBP family intramembrane glutamic endopeptidase [Labilithrix sp.]